jgi:hypothetical protein
MLPNSFFDLTSCWSTTGLDPVCQYCCLQIPAEDNGMWDLKFPNVEWNDRTVVILHCQDFVNVNNNGCRELNLIEQHYGDRANRVVAVTWNMDLASVYSGPVNIVYFPYHSYELLTNLRNTMNQWLPNLALPRTQRFQCLNGVAKKHRIRTVELVRHYPNSIITLDPHLVLEEFSYRDHLSVSNEENFIRLSRSVYGACDINIVTESLYNHYPGIITEKSIFAWLSLQVPILIGYPGIVAHARSLGFDMFDDVVDHSYDQLPNHLRAQAAIELNNHLLVNGIDRNRLQSRLEHNHQHALTWPDRMRSSYQQQVNAIHQRLTTGR